MSVFLSLLANPWKLKKNLKISEHNQLLESDTINTAHCGGDGGGDSGDDGDSGGGGARDQP